MKLYLLCSLWLLSTAGVAQPRVYHVSGEAYCQSRGGQQRLQFRDAVPPGQALVLKPGCQLVLLNEQGRVVAFSQPGTVPYAAVQQAFAATAPNPTQAYLAYVARKMREQPIPLAQQGNAPVGGVSRGEQLRLWAPADSAVLDQSEVTFQWVSAEDGPFLFTITDAAGSPVLQLKTPASTLGLSLPCSPLQRNAVYYWSVVPAASPSSNAVRRPFLWPEEGLLKQFAPLLPVTAGSLSLGEQQWQAQFRATWFYGLIR